MITIIAINKFSSSNFKVPVPYVLKFSHELWVTEPETENYKLEIQK